MTYREWPTTCKCGFEGKLWGWNTDPISCPLCAQPTALANDGPRDTLMIAGDELHGYSARHGVCWPDGTPRKFYSKTDLKRALNEAGLNVHGDTPKPYNVAWSGHSKDT